MARSRNIKPGFFTNDSLAECEPLARILFAGLWCHADREGRLEDRPKKIKAEILPYDDVDANILLSELAARGFIQRYVVDERAYIQVFNFLKHQNPHIKEQASTIPAPGMSGACPVQEPYMPESCPADSLNLIPDSIETTLSGTPDDGEASDTGSTGTPQPQHKVHIDTAHRVLAFLNEKTGRHYRPVDANMKLIVARLKEGATETECRQVIAKKTREWSGNPDRVEYLRPATLFNATKFAQYQGELDAAEVGHGH